MRLILQRTSGVELKIDDKVYSQSGSGLLVLAGTTHADNETVCSKLADKTLNLRIFEDNQGKMNLSALDIRADIMVVSQFTLYADCRKGRRPSFNEAQLPQVAERMYSYFVRQLENSGLNIKTGLFGAVMDVRFSNVGPVTIILDDALL